MRVSGPFLRLYFGELFVLAPVRPGYGDPQPTSFQKNRQVLIGLPAALVKPGQLEPPGPVDSALAGILGGVIGGVRVR